MYHSMFHKYLILKKFLLFNHTLNMNFAILLDLGQLNKTPIANLYSEVVKGTPDIYHFTLFQLNCFNVVAMQKENILLKNVARYGTGGGYFTYPEVNIFH